MLTRVAEVTRKLRHARNIYAPINRLPPELLSSIFLLLSPPPAPFTCPRITEWYKITHVCQRWRAVAMGCRSLWEKVDLLAGPEWVREMLERGGNAPIELRVLLMTPSERTKGKLSMIRTHLRRARAIHLSVDQASWSTFLPEETSTRMPHLRSLIISCSRHLDHKLPIPSSLFSGGAPYLEHLELVHCTILDYSLDLLCRCPWVKTLRLKNIASAWLNVHVLLDMLESMPLLEELSLVEVLPLNVSKDLLQPTTRVVSLPRLLKLQLHEDTGKVAALLRSLHLPAGITTSVTCFQPSQAELSVVGTALTSIYQTSENLARLQGMDILISCAGVRIHVAPGAGLPGQLFNWAEMGMQGSLLLDLSAELGLNEEVRQLMSAFVTLLRAMPLQNIASLCVDDEEGFMDGEVLLDILRTMPNLRTLQVTHEPGAYLPEILSLYPEHPAIHDTSAHLLPKLDHLLLKGIDLSCTVEDTGLSFLSRLQEAQFLRCEHGQAISELTIEHCFDVSKEDVRVLCQLFVDVHWDGAEISWSEENGDEGFPEENEYGPLWDMWDAGHMGWH